MPNVIEIVIHATDAATAQIRGVQGSVAGLEASFGALRAATIGAAGIAAAFAVAGVAAAGLANRLSNEIEMLQNLSARTGATVNDLRTLRQVMVEAGMSPDSLTQALTLLNRKLADNDPALRRLVGGTNSPMQALLTLSRLVAGGMNAASASFVATGRGGGDLAAILGTLSERFADVHARLGDLDEATIRAAGAWDLLMDRMGTATKRFLDGVGAQLLKFLDFMASSGGMIGALARSMGFGKEAPAPVVGGSEGAGGPGKIGKVEQFGGMDLEETKRMQAEALARFRAAHAEIVTLTESITFGLASSIDSVFANLTNKFQTFGSAIKTLFDGLAQSVLSALAKIATSRLLIWISGFLIPGGGSGVGQGLGGIIRDIGKGMVGSNAVSEGRGGNTIVIQTLDTRNLRANLMPGGSLNRAQDQVLIGARY